MKMGGPRLVCVMHCTSTEYRGGSFKCVLDQRGASAAPVSAKWYWTFLGWKKSREQQLVRSVIFFHPIWACSVPVYRPRFFALGTNINYN